MKGLQTIKVEKIGKRMWKVQEDFTFHYGKTVTVPKGFITDGASVPRIFWWFLDPATELFEAGVVHDYMLSIEDKRAHVALYKAAQYYRVPKYKCKIVFYGVRSYFFFKNLLGIK